MGKYAIFIVSALIFSMLAYSNALRNALFQSEFRNIESFSQLQASNIANSAALVVINDIRNNSDSDFVPDAGETYSYPSSTGFADWEDLAGSYNVKSTNQADTLLVIESTGRFGEAGEFTNYRATVGVTKGGTSDWFGASVDKAIHSESEMNLGNGNVEGDLSLNSSHEDFDGGPNADVVGSLYFYDEGVVYEDELEEYEDMFTEPDDASDDYEHMYQMDEKIVHPPPIFPQFTVSGTNSYNGRNETVDYSSYSSGVHFDSFTTNNVTINTGDEDTETKIYTRTLDLSKDLDLSGEGSVSFYVEESLDIHGGDINKSGLPENLAIYYKGTEDIRYRGNSTFKGTLFANYSDVSIDIGGKATFFGNVISFGDDVKIHGNPDASSLVFAPNADVTLNGTPGSFRGAIVSDTFEGTGQPSVIYDEEFASTLPNLKQEDDDEFVLTYWN